MEKKDLEIQLLLEQRKALISDTKELNSNMFKVIVVVIPLIITIFVTYFPDINETGAYIIRYVVLEIILILSMVICACLFAANINRDYISAIDIYLFEKFDISVLFYSGELSKKHTTGMDGIFPRTTGLIGCSAVSLIAIFLIYILIHDKSFYLSNWWLLIISAMQILAYILIIYANFRRKVTEKSDITEECLKYINRAKVSAQQKES